jgi:hypothetical protein
MKLILAFSLITCAFAARAQDTTTFRVSPDAPAKNLNLKVDTNEVVYTRKGQALHYYQYKKFIESGKFIIRVEGDVNDPKRKLMLKRR